MAERNIIFPLLCKHFGCHTYGPITSSLPCRSDTSEDEMDDQDVNQILIVTQKPRRILAKHPQGDRTSGSHQSRTKMTADLAQAIDDGLYYYEQVKKLVVYFL